MDLKSIATKPVFTSLKQKTGQFVKIIYQLTLVVIFVVTIGFIIYIYQNFYRAITSAEYITILRNEVAMDKINLNLFEKINQALKEKTTPLSITKTLKNIFKNYE